MDVITALDVMTSYTDTSKAVGGGTTRIWLRENVFHIIREVGMKKKVSGAGEWADVRLNLISGCSNDCLYCYAHESAERFRRRKGRDWKNEEIVSERSVETIKRYTGRIMYPSTHDITPEHLEESLTYIERILVAGNRLLIVSKPHLECIRAICNRFHSYRDKITFRFTIGSANSAVLKFWEPGAPDFAERLASLKYAHSQGYATSVSCEPMLDLEIDKVIDQVLPYVTDSIWLGKANKLRSRLTLNGHKNDETLRRAAELLSWQSDANIWALYERYRDNPMIKWKESIKIVVGIDLATEAGLDQ
jgi:DNA repair photolyase